MGSCSKHAAEAKMVTSLHYHKITLLIGEHVNAACLPTPEIANGSFVTIINLADLLHLFGFNYSRDYQFPIKKNVRDMILIALYLGSNLSYRINNYLPRVLNQVSSLQFPCSSQSSRHVLTMI